MEQFYKLYSPVHSGAPGIATQDWGGLGRLLDPTKLCNPVARLLHPLPPTGLSLETLRVSGADLNSRGRSLLCPRAGT